VARLLNSSQDMLRIGEDKDGAQTRFIDDPYTKLAVNALINALERTNYALARVAQQAGVQFDQYI